MARSKLSITGFARPVGKVLISALLLMGVGRAEIRILSITNTADYINTVGVQFEIPQPGGLASIFCTGLTGSPGIVAANAYPLPLQLGGVSVDVFGVPAPILAVAFLEGYQQINIQVPFESVARHISGVLIASVEVKQSGQYGQVDVQTALGLGRLFADPNGYGILQHTDYSLVTPAHPARPGEIILLYGTGMSAADWGVQTGYPAPSEAQDQGSVVDVTVGSVRAEVLFEGNAPGLVGVNQINFRVPGSAGVGDLPLYISGTRTGCAPFWTCENGQQPSTAAIASLSVKIPVR